MIQSCAKRLSEEVAAGRLHGETSVRADVLGSLITIEETVQWLTNADELAPDDLEQFAILAWQLSRSTDNETADEEIQALTKGLQDRDMTILRLRYAPSTLMTLEEVGNRFGVTRERIRQIQKKAPVRLSKGFQQYPLLRLRSAIRFAQVKAETGSGIDEITEDLMQRGLIISKDAADDLWVIWQSTNLETPFITGLRKAAREGLSPRQIEVRPAINLEARKLCRNCGAFNVKWLTVTADTTDIRVVLLYLGYEEILPGWYWKNVVSKDVVESVARKVFSVTDQVSPREFRRSFVKHLSRREYTAPPSDVLLEVAKRIEFIRFDGDNLMALRDFEPSIELNGSEFALYRFLSESGPVANFQELYVANRNAGYQTITLAVRLKQSPVIRRLGHGLYSLVGSSYTQTDIDNAVARVEEIPADGEIRYNTNGIVTYLINASPWLLYGGVLSTSELSGFKGDWYTL
jgi:hypothetical protein